MHSGGGELAQQIELEGYDAWRPVTTVTILTPVESVPMTSAVDSGINGRTITYLDSASSSLPPRAVIEAMSRHYERHHANVHRGVYQTANESTESYEGAREAIARFINAPHGANEIVFTKNATEGFNLLAKSWAASSLKPGDVVLLSEMEHHANIVPWFQLRESHGSRFASFP